MTGQIEDTLQYIGETYAIKRPEVSEWAVDRSISYRMLALIECTQPTGRLKGSVCAICKTGLP